MLALLLLPALVAEDPIDGEAPPLLRGQQRQAEEETEERTQRLHATS